MVFVDFFWLEVRLAERRERSGKRRTTRIAASGRLIGTNKRVAKADFRYFDGRHNCDCWDATRNTTSLVLQRRHDTAVPVERAAKIEWVVDR
jgi:hypothetical protein